MRIPYLTKLIQNLKDRFPSVEILSAFSIFNPAELPQTEAELAQYGDSELSVLLAHYSSGPLTINSEAAREEWKEFKAFLSQPNLDIASLKDLAEFVFCREK